MHRSHLKETAWCKSWKPRTGVTQHLTSQPLCIRTSPSLRLSRYGGCWLLAASRAQTTSTACCLLDTQLPFMLALQDGKDVSWKPLLVSSHSGCAPMVVSTAGVLQVKVVGLHGLSYLDNTNSMAKGTESSQEVTFSGELDRIYISTPDKLEAGSASACGLHGLA